MILIGCYRVRNDFDRPDYQVELASHFGMHYHTLYIIDYALHIIYHYTLHYFDRPDYQVELASPSCCQDYLPRNPPGDQDLY